MNKNLDHFNSVSNKKNATDLIKSFINENAQMYSRLRNFDFGSIEKNFVSGLSPAISHRLITEHNFVKEILKKYPFRKVEKLVQEICWRTYWKGYLEHHKSIWNNYKLDLERLKGNKITDKYISAVEGNTQIRCFNDWTNELRDNGYLHNHTRMWYASIWIFTLKLPWQLGAEFFMQNLLDADAASNTLSWRWVAGLHTKGKTYLARPSNIMKFTNNRYHPQNELANFAKIQTEDHTIMPNSITYTNYEKPRKVKCLLIHENDVSLEDIPNFDHLFVQKSHCSTINRSNLVKNYVDNLLSDCLRRSLKKSKQKPKIFNFSDKTKLKDFVNENEIKNIFTHYPGIGYLKDELKHFSKVSGVNMKYFITDWDSRLWPHASKGFFKLKKKIPEILGDMLRDQT